MENLEEEIAKLRMEVDMIGQALAAVIEAMMDQRAMLTLQRAYLEMSSEKQADA